MAVAAAALFAALYVVLALFPAVIYWLCAVEQTASSDVIARRSAMFFLGPAILTFMVRALALASAACLPVRTVI